MNKERYFKTKLKDHYLRIGWIIGDQLNKNTIWYRINYLVGGIALARFFWLAQWINKNSLYPLQYEIYRPWKHYDGILCLKAMGEKVIKLVLNYKKAKRPVLFDANVNYYKREGHEYYFGMLPSEQQQKDAIKITKTVNGVIADSEFIKKQCLQYNSNVCWIPDAIALDYVPPFRPWNYTGGKIPLLWSGEAIKLFELLAIEDVLLKYSKFIELILITNDLSYINRWLPGYKEKFQKLISIINCKIISYNNILNLFQVYANGGVAISPRFLDNSYNFGHTEWKITLAMACGRLVICSPVPSYVKVWERSGGKGIRICCNNEEWEKAIDEILSGSVDWNDEGKAARNIVEKYYAVSEVGKTHASYLLSFFPEVIKS
jgi:glycosyltransferase involved in cell wall biosynthesis